MTLKERGFRRLGGNDIIREGDFQWTKTGTIAFIDPTLSIVLPDNIYFGCQVCTELIQNHANYFYRKLKVKDAPQQTQI